MTRDAILNLAKNCVCGKREEDHGMPENNFGTISAFWTDYLQARGFLPATCCLENYDVGVMMALLKIARISGNPTHSDSWVDLAGYAACGGELAT